MIRNCVLVCFHVSSCELRWVFYNTFSHGLWGLKSWSLRTKWTAVMDGIGVCPLGIGVGCCDGWEDRFKCGNVDREKR